ncbi:MAG: hypothetical protein EBT13_11300 [Rhodobacteraceae bacterium]|nr:hypothetical protein [Paracoccaceae bacterium]
MPNWCRNHAIIRPLTAQAAADLERCLVPSPDRAGLLHTMFPMPAELDIEARLTPAGQDESKEYATNRAAYGHPHWYSWRMANWGTKWEVEIDTVERLDDGTIEVWFDSAWSPPIEAFALAMERYSVRLTYLELCQSFAGCWENGRYLEDGWITTSDPEGCRRDFPIVSEVFAGDLLDLVAEEGEN